MPVSLRSLAPRCVVQRQEHTQGSVERLHSAAECVRAVSSVATFEICRYYTVCRRTISGRSYFRDRLTKNGVAVCLSPWVIDLLQVRTAVFDCSAHPQECGKGAAGSSSKSTKASHIRVYPHGKGVDGDKRAFPSVFPVSEVGVCDSPTRLCVCVFVCLWVWVCGCVGVRACERLCVLMDVLSLWIVLGCHTDSWGHVCVSVSFVSNCGMESVCDW